MPASANAADRDPTAGLSAWVEVDLDAIRDNTAELARRASGADVLAVVKADGYGHGGVEAAGAALAGGATWLGVAQLEEALLVKSAWPDVPVVTWLYPPGADHEHAVASDLDITVSSVASLAEVVAAADATRRTARVHLKVDTGLARNGARGEEWAALVTAAADAEADEAVDVIGVWSHFACADEPEHPANAEQLDAFDAACDDLARAGLRPQVRHIANSAALLTNPRSHYDLVRPGIGVYGLSPVPHLGAPAAYGLREAMTVRARLANLKRVPAGTGVSYGLTYTTDRETVLGLVPVGYADGVPRAASSTAPVQVGGHRTRVTGRVCMDQLVVDLGPDYGGAVGDDVVLWGRGDRSEPTAQEWAEATGTISYEIVTRVSSRLDRVHIGDVAAYGPESRDEAR